VKIRTAFFLALALLLAGCGTHRSTRPLPTTFDPLALSALDDSRFFAFGTLPCSAGRCFAIERTTDGGRTWSSRPLPPLPTGRSDTYEVVPTAVPGQMVIARGTAETVFAPHSILVFGSTGQKLQRNHLDTGHASMDSAVVTPDGSLVMEL